MNLLRIGWRLLRYRVAVMLVLFMCMGAALHGGFTGGHAWQLGWAVLALAASYISATSVNDLADRQIDAINHADNPGRMLVSGQASVRDMWLAFGVASTVAVVAGGLVRPAGALIILGSVFINVTYSVRPVRLSYRTFLAPLALAIGYVGVPYLLGVTAAGQTPGAADARWLAGLYVLFVGRIILKDFRDRKGDAAFGKPTFLLRFGKTATCLASGVLVAAGGGVLGYQVRHCWWLALLTGLFVAAILAMLVRLHRAPMGKQEQLSIGVGAKMGNGLLIVLVLGTALQVAGVRGSDSAVAVAAVAALFFINFGLFLKDPAAAVIGYKG